MGTKEEHKERIKELEELRSEIKDTGTEVTVDEADFGRAVHDGQIVENVKWISLMDGSAKVDPPTVIPENVEMNEALADIKERVEGLQDAGYMPKTKPLLYYLDFLTMELNRVKARIETESDLVKLQDLTVLQYKTEAKMEMTIDWLKAQDQAGDWGSMTLGDRGHEVSLPKFGSKAEVEEAIKTRHLPRHGETEEELIAGRSKRYRDDAERITDGIDGQNKRDADANSA